MQTKCARGKKYDSTTFKFQMTDFMIIPVKTITNYQKFKDKICDAYE